MIDISKLMRYVSSWDKYEVGEVIFFDGVPSDDRVYIIVEGTANVYKNYQQPGEICFASLGAGDFFGEMSLFLGRERTATIVATETMSIFAINRVDVVELIRVHPEIAFSFLETICARLEISNSNSAANLMKYKQDLTLLNQGLDALNAKNRKLEIAASADPLTGIHNRRYFMESAGALANTPVMKDMNPFVVIFDLDHFKKINDEYGHDAGDRVLIYVADLIKNAIRPSDIFARYGGEEFIILANCEKADDILPFLERLRATVCARPLDYNGIKITVTASFGVAPLEDSLLNAISNADQAMYKSKSDGRNKVTLYERK